MQSSQQSIAANSRLLRPKLRHRPRLRLPTFSTPTRFAITTAPRTIWPRRNISDYIKFYPNTDLAGNSYFYLAELQFRAGNYKEAVANYDQVLQNFPSGSKAASAQLKKGFALIEMGQKDDGVQELRHLIQRYPKTNEAVQAKERLRKLNTSAANKPGV